jgi:hypothetical protein
MKRAHLSPQNGSAFFIILIAIATFAMLSYAVLQGGRSSAGSLSTEQARSAAQEIISYAEAVQKSVQTLRLRGCTQQQISVERSGLPSTANALSPANGSCDVFGSAGGKLIYNNPTTEWLDPAQSSAALYNQWFFTTGSCLVNIGSGNTPACPAAEAEIVLILPWVKQSICTAINKSALPAETAIPLATTNAYLATEELNGVFSGGATIKTSGSTLAGKSSGCFQGNTSNPVGGYHYYHVLLAR